MIDIKTLPVSLSNTSNAAGEHAAGEVWYFCGLLY